MGVCNCSMFCCTLLCVRSGFAIILMGKRELVALLGLSFWCLVVAVWLFLAVPWVCQQFVIVVFSDHTHYFRVTVPTRPTFFQFHRTNNQKVCNTEIVFLGLYMLSLVTLHLC